MSLTDFRTLGRSGLVVSPLALGTMTFGPGDWGADEATSRAIFEAYRGAGGNFVDTADIYSGGESERLVGKFIADSGARDEVVLATKFAFNSSASPLTATRAGGGNPNAGGSGAKNIHRALGASLKRLGTDYIDLYWMHIWDCVTPIEEIVQTFGDSKFVDRNWDILDVLEAVSAELDRPMAQVALAWTLARNGVASTVIGASKVSQLTSNIAATELRLSGDQMGRLDEASAPPPGFTAALTSPFIRRMVFGGRSVVGWGE